MKVVLHLMLAYHTFITWALMGLIWHVQIVQYPLFMLVGRDTFNRFHRGHCLRISFLVGPLILLEAATAVWLFWQGERSPAFLGGLGLIVAVWISTFFVQVPLHDKLTEKGWSAVVIQRLIRTNWVRTLAWTTRAFLLAWLFSKGR